MLDRITPLVLTYNESENIGRTLAALSWAREVVVVDSFSSDDTLEIVRGFANARLVQRRFDRFEHQWNHGLHHCGITSEWVLALDADYVVPREALTEFAELNPAPDVSGFSARFRYCIDGTPLRGSLYPPVTVLFRKQQARFVQDGHTQRVRIEQGRVDWLRTALLHDDRKPLSRWLSSQERYAEDEAAKLAGQALSELDWPDRVRKVPLLAAPLVGLHCLLGKGCLLDGRAGAQYTAQRMVAELLISVKLLGRNLR